MRNKEIIEHLETIKDIYIDDASYSDKEAQEFNKTLRTAVEEAIKIVESRRKIRKVGRWIENVYVFADVENVDFYECSSCKSKQLKMSNYCPNCGAKMEGEDGEDSACD